LELLLLCYLAGLSEFVHQTVHLNLFSRSRGWNRSLGRIAAALLSIDFDNYRTFHLNHHRFANTANDPERPFYKEPAYLKMVAGWEGMEPSQKIVQLFRVLGYAAGALASFGGDKPFVRATRWLVPIALATSGFIEGLHWYLIPVKVIVTWYLPLLLLLPVDVAFAQSEHYQTKELEGDAAKGIIPLDVQYALSWNLRFPAIAEFFLLKRNQHAEHHLVPAIHWTQARDRGEGRMLRVTEYLLMQWRQGPRS
jgi:fatty acid desaturase